VKKFPSKELSLFRVIWENITRTKNDPAKNYPSPEKKNLSEEYSGEESSEVFVFFEKPHIQ
jgi:hypothetical protein